MTIGLVGRRRNGKSLLATVLGLYFSIKKNVPLYSNCQIKTSLPITLKQLLYDARNCVVVLDEFWRDMDSWNWKSPTSRYISQWYQLQGHRDIVILYTTQLLSQINNRIRESTDYFILCEKKKGERGFRFKYTFIDGFSGEVIFVMKADEDKIKKFYKYYDYVGYVDSLLDENEHR